MPSLIKVTVIRYLDAEGRCGLGAGGSFPNRGAPSGRC